MAEDAGAWLGTELPFATTVLTLDISVLFRDEPGRDRSRW